jgi:hypothetical protein
MSVTVDSAGGAVTAAVPVGSAEIVAYAALGSGLSPPLCVAATMPMMLAPRIRRLSRSP